MYKFVRDFLTLNFLLRWQLIADRNEGPCTTIRRFLSDFIGTTSLDRNHLEVTAIIR